MWVVAAVVLALFVLAFLAYWKFWFLRQPIRLIPTSGIVSPAMGLLVKIVPFSDGVSKVVPKGLLGVVRTLTSDVAREGYLLVIRLTPLDVHYQRAPVSGEVLKQTYTKGKFRNAVLGAGSLRTLENEKNEILIQARTQRVKVVQVAGVAARRISSYVSPRQQLEKGEVIGLINFGSQVLLIIPKQKLQVKEGDYLVDGETVIA